MFGNLEGFKGQHAMGIDQRARFLVTKVIAPIGNALMDMRNHFAALPRAGVPFGALAKRRCALARAFSSVRKKRGLAIFARVQCGKARSPTSTPTARSVAGNGAAPLDREAGIPLAAWRATQRQCFDGALDRAMQHQAQCANLRDTQKTILHRKPRLFEGEAIVAPWATKTRESLVSRQL